MSKSQVSSKGTSLYYVLVFVYLFFALVVTIFSLKISDDLRSFTNKSNSMSPLIDTGSVTIVKKDSTYEPGDIISFYDSENKKEEVVTHRIVSIGGNVYVTRGDANEVVDQKIVAPRLVIGKVIFIIPYLGHVITYAKSSQGLILTIILPAILIILVELWKIIRVYRNER